MGGGLEMIFLRIFLATWVILSNAVVGVFLAEKKIDISWTLLFWAGCAVSGIGLGLLVFP